jgi:hypothetical protein
MKIRIKGNALRYRLTKSDTSTLANAGYLQEKTIFSAQALIYAIRITEDDALSATYEENKIILLMPKAMIASLVTTEEVGFSGVFGQLQLLVEKDFTCLDNVAEDQSDNYPNPLTLSIPK